MKVLPWNPYGYDKGLKILEHLIISAVLQRTCFQTVQKGLDSVTVMVN